MTMHAIETAAQEHHLSIFGALHPEPGDVPTEIRTILLLGPSEPGFWAGFTAAGEYHDGQPDPLDRWSKRVIGGIATNFDAEALFPSDGPPYPPFIKWAKASGRAFVSPVGLLVHDTAGLWVSYRGALGLRQKLALPPPPANPCISCENRDCIGTCPVGALQPYIYDVAACKADLDRLGNDCMACGCAARRACPVSQRYGRIAAQSAFHMEAFR